MPLPILSIITPTKKSRLDETVTVALKSALAVPRNDIEVILHVDVDTEEPVLDIPKIFTDPRLRYIEHPKTIPMTENWNRAMTYATGRYVVYIGDDDAVLPWIAEAAEWAERQGLDNVLQQGRSLYYWPSYPKPEKAGLFISNPYSGRVEHPDIKRVSLENSHGPKMLNYPHQPEVYHGLMRRETMEVMKKKTGRYFGSVIPDLYLAFAVAPFIRKYAVVDYPFSLSGHSGKANAARFAKKRMGEQEKQYAEYPWAPEIPKTTDYVSFYMDSKITAYRESGQEALLKNLNLPLCYAMALLNRPWKPSKILRLLSQFRTLKKPSWLKLFFNLFWLMVQRVNLKMPYALHVFERKHNVIFKTNPKFKSRLGSMEEALKVMDKQLGGLKNAVEMFR